MGLLGGNDGGFEDARLANERNRLLLDQIKDPRYSEMVPELYNTEQTNYTLNTEDPVLKSMQMQSLNKMAGLADSGQSDIDAAGYDQARSLGNQFAKAGTGAAIQDSQNRGIAGSGQEMALREMANQGGAERAHTAAIQQAADAARQRALYAQAYGTQVAGARDQSAKAGQANTNIINQFNQANTQLRNQTAAANVGQRQNAFEYNEGLKDKNYQNQLGRLDRVSGNNNRSAEIAAAQAEADRKKRGAVGGAIGGVVGGIYGGPGGAAAGSAVGSSVA